ncbi:unnamed protein product [Cercospora beticola]|nr:unnamed protein product [Cercospora beticola]
MLRRRWGRAPRMRLYTEQQCIFTDTIDAQLFRQYLPPDRRQFLHHLSLVQQQGSSLCCLLGPIRTSLSATHHYTTSLFNNFHFLYTPLPSLGDTFAGGTTIVERI